MALASMPETDTRLGYSKTAATLPLVWRELESTFARVGTSLPLLDGRTGDISTADFVGQCSQIAAKLPAGSQVLNLCENPYLFTLAFGAALIRGQTTLLPQNRSPETLQRLVALYPSSYVLHDGKAADVAGVDQADLSQWRVITPYRAAIPSIERDFPAAIAFTSGSTGQPKAIVKPWHTLVTSALMNGACMLPQCGDTLYQLATVPPQHMWGLETGVLIPLFWPVCVADSRPMFPAGIVAALQDLPPPRLLVSTPVHLRALLGSHLAIPTCLRTLCATAPLAADLARACEAQTGGELLEVYGCSEIGSTAHRRTSSEALWHLIPGLAFRTLSPPSIGGDHLPEDQLLQDRVETSADGFKLLGRNEDMVNVGGKRGSLMEITQVLLDLPGISDAVVFLPEDGDENTNGRPAALVVGGDQSLAEIHNDFVRRLDAVFFPRPLLFVDSLPRESTGKLHRDKLLALYRERRSHTKKT